MKGIEITFSAAPAFIFTAMLNCVNGKTASSKDKKKCQTAVHLGKIKTDE